MEKKVQNKNYKCIFIDGLINFVHKKTLSLSY